ncbi:ATP-binding protein [Flavobacterium psychrophilum]|jgi:signal transduction histidine kinase|nr:ATP-binding protein [Flavobacterium psychrophilum]EKT4510593.1 ATP-binding protein [Flavobacterium psychrophilum]
MDNSKQLLKLKEQLSQEVQKEHSDNNLILSLSNSIINLDDEQVRFSIDAGLIDRLGKELVARQETAVSELVKNCYDADANNVTLSFIDSDAIGGTLKIQDDGDGMNREELVNGFMRISSTDKLHNPVSRAYKRKRAGQKGIGRFAVQRLGNKLTIITQTLDSNDALMLTIDWDDYKGDTNLGSISNTLKIIPKKREKGTTLIISGLRERWSEAAIQRIYNYVSDIIQPFALTERKNIEDQTRIDDTKDSGFKTKFVKINDTVSKSIGNELLQFHSSAVATIEGWIDETGIGIYTIESDKLGINEVNQIGNDPDNNTIPFDKLKNVKFRAYYFIYDSDLVPKMQSTKIKRLAQTQGGIRLYRNGFRVLPYGEPSNDWLKLDKSLRTRSILPSHGNNNFFGFVELTDAENNFNETSSREGLTENDELIQLQNFIYRTIITGVIKVAEVRNIKITPSQKKNEKGNWEKIEFRIKNIAHTLEALDKELENDTGSVESKKRRKKSVKKVQDALEEIKKIQKEEQEKTFKERSMLRVLSSVGLTIAQFIHEIKYYMDNIQSDIRFLVIELQQQQSALERINILNDNFSAFHTYTSYFDNVVSQNVIRELIPLDLRNVVKPFLNSISADASKSGINFEEPQFNKYRLFTKPMHPSEWSSILFNFYTNSKKAIKRANVAGKILIECGEFNDKVYLEFSDNGDGISMENEEKIFDEFFTTTSSESFEDINEHNEILGTGLGLKIVRDIIKSYKGNVSVVSPKGDYVTCIRIEIPKATDKDIEKYGL